MRLEESLAVRRILKSTCLLRAGDFTHVINLGSGDVVQLLRRKPWIDQNVFDPMRKLGLKVVNVDFIAYPGVDVVADFSTEDALDFTRQLAGRRLFILANVIEHVPHAVRNNLFQTLDREMSSGDALLITAPAAYPYHPDPIDTLYRVSPENLQEKIALTWLIGEQIACGSYLSDLAGMPRWKRVRKIVKPLIPLMSPKKYLAALHQFTFLFRPYEITIVLGLKTVQDRAQL